MTAKNAKSAGKIAHRFRCAVYTRKSSEDGLEQEFNSLDAQREAGEAYIKSQASEGWECLSDHYDDGGFTGGNMERPAVQRLMADIEAGRIDCVVVYKVDRLSRSLLDFARMMEVFERHNVSFVSVTQQFNTATSMGRLILNVLLSFAQFEREMISERTRDKIAATRRKGKWSGGMPLLGYDVVDTKLVVDPGEAEMVRAIFELYLELDGMLPVVQELERRGWVNKLWTTKKGIERGGRPFDKNSLWHLLTNVTYIGKVKYKDEIHNGEHEAIIDGDLWQRVQAKLKRNGRTGGKMVRNKFGALLKGLLHCSPCDCAMTPTHATREGKKRYRYYICTTAQKRGRNSCPSGSIPAGEIERFVVEQIRCIGRDPQLVAETVRQAHGETRQRADELAKEERRVERELAGHHRGMQKLIRSPSAGEDNGLAAARFADLQDRITSTERRLTEVRDEVERQRRDLIDEAEVAKAMAEFDPVWESLSPREQGRLLQLLIERIDYDGRDGMVSITFHAGGIKALANHEFAGDAA
ncbi:MAG: recombinase family protein [Pirellulaceae bacterium]